MKSKPDSDLFRQHGLTRLINVSGTETPKGAAPVSMEVLAAVNALAPHSVDMLELQAVASRTIARATGAEAGIVAHCTAAGISMAVAACMTGADWAHMRQLPRTRGMKNEVILQRGHHVDYSGDLTQNIRLTGARARLIGTQSDCRTGELRAAISPRTTAALYVVSHLTAAAGLIAVKDFIAECRRRRVPVIVDAASEPDPRPFLRAGADLVIVSLHKQFASLTGAMIIGRLSLVRACLYQESGIARPMKAGKEAVIAGIAALERWSQAKPRALAARLNARLERSRRSLAVIPGIAPSIEIDATSHAFSRLHLRISARNAALSAAGLAAGLQALNPSIHVRISPLEPDILQLDLRRVSDETARHVVNMIKALMGGRAKNRMSAMPSFNERLAQFPR